MNNFDSPATRVSPPCDLPSQRGLTSPRVVDTEACADFGEFYRAFVPTLVVFLLWEGARLAVAADITQQTMAKACQRWSQVDDPPRWARTIASRKLARRIARIDNQDAEQFGEPPTLVSASVDVHAWHQQHDILTMLEVLSPRQRQVIAWILSGYSTAEIAGQLHITVAAVQEIRNKARGALAVYRGHENARRLGDFNPKSPVLVESDAWLAGHYHALINDVRDSLEIPAGLGEILTPIHRGESEHSHDGTASSATPVPASPPRVPTTHLPLPRPAASSSVATGSDDTNAASATPNAPLLTFLQTAATWDPSMRLAVRAHPVFTLTSFGDRAHALVVALDATTDLASVLARALDCVLRRTLDRALAHDPAVFGDPDQALARDLGLARDIAGQLDRDLDMTRNQARHLARDLACDLVRIRDLAVLPSLDLDYILDRILTLPRVSNYARLSARSLVDDLAGVQTAIDDFSRVGGFAHDLAQTLQALSHLHHLLSDVSGFDLRDTDLTGIALEGLRWSSATRWPPQLQHQIRRCSTPIADHLFVIGPTDATDLSITA
jgi:RNA polymerase sigma-70 factor (ECF subfamily)